MRPLMTTLLFVSLIVPALTGSTVSAASQAASVRVEFKQPGPVATGEESTVVITFRALADLDRLDVKVKAYEGLEVVSEPTVATFQAVRRGDGPQLTVTIRLTDPKEGTLAIFFETVRGDEREGGATGIAFGHDNDSATANRRAAAIED